VAFFEHLSWDGRQVSLEEQSLDAITNEKEMGLATGEIADRVRPKYGRAFMRVYGEVSPHAVAAAIASYQRTLLAGDSPFDHYVYLGDENAISDAAKRGFEIFTRKGRCIQCHMVRCDDCHPFGGRSAFFMNNRFHNLGVGFDTLGRAEDRGRIDVTHRDADDGAFKTPTLRNVALTAPYMHDGSLATLRDVVDHYDRGGVANSHLDLEIRPLHLTTDEKEALVAYLEALTSTALAGDPALRGASPSRVASTGRQ
jgi:cytochrome c peroxidase